MREAYPIVISKTTDGYYVSIPDFDIATQGSDIPNAIYMARDANELMGVTLMEDNKQIPKPYTFKIEKKDEDIVTLVDVDFTSYKKRLDNKSVKKNCTIPYWLNEKAEKAGINFSRVLQDALIEMLGDG
jgi:predicted RNase H-like HicB family nuclease